ncbi:MAG: 5-(carboxyamino)imidazole ribonucleotide mutase [Candidatus Acidiferrales bacterium]
MVDRSIANKSNSEGPLESSANKLKALVGIIMGSDTDYPMMAEAAKTLDKFGIVYEMEVTSAHRSPGRTHEYSTSAAGRGLKCIIVGAGGAAHLAGVVAATTTLPVIGVPLATTPLNGMDSLLAVVQMPAGIPVATMAIDKAGATNAAILAAQIIGLSDAGVAKRLAEHKEELAKGVAQKNARLQEQLSKSTK